MPFNRCAELVLSQAEGFNPHLFPPPRIAGEDEGGGLNDWNDWNDWNVWNGFYSRHLHSSTDTVF
jgi:hypothetical protein